MKKIILTVLVTLGVAAIGCGFIINDLNIKHAEELDALKVDHQIEVNGINNMLSKVGDDLEEAINDYVELDADVNELYEQVYNMQNGEAYEIKIKHDGETHIWSSDNKGLFSSEKHMVMY